MTQNLVEQLRYIKGVFPRKVLEKIVNNQKQYTPELLNIIEYAANHMQELLDDPDDMAHIYAIYFLSQFREKKAYPLIVDFFSVPGEISLDITGDLVTEDLGNILASVSHGDTSRMKALVENKEIHEYVRSASLRGLLTLVACGKKSRDEIMEYYTSLFQGKLSKDDSDVVWDNLAMCSNKLYPEEVSHYIEQVYDEGMIDAFYLTMEQLKYTLSREKESVLCDLQNNPRYQFIQDVIGEMENWACFNIKEKKSHNPKKEKKLHDKIIEKRNKIGRNDTCFCGSGLKYKKCCGSNSN